MCPPLGQAFVGSAWPVLMFLFALGGTETLPKLQDYLFRDFAIQIASTLIDGATVVG